MAQSKAQKQKIVEDLQEKIEKQKAIVFFDFTGLKVKDLSRLRKKMKQDRSEIKVVKKTLFDLALKKAGLKAEIRKLKGEIAAAFGFEDEIAPAKICYQFSQENPNLKILGGFFEGEFKGAEEMTVLAQIPSREELLAKLVWSISAPVSNFVYALQYNLKGLINILSLIKK